MPKGVFVGLSTIDVVYRVDQFPATNSKIVAGSQDVYVGGPATNASITFAHLGGTATLVTGIGSHAIGGVIKHELQQFAVSLVDLDARFDQPPPISAIAVNHVGERNVISANAALHSTPPAYVDEAALEACSIVMVDGHFMEACRAWAKAARTRGIRVVLDGGSWKEGTAELLENVDIAICSSDFKPPKCATEDEVLRYLQGHGVKNIAITHGGEPVGLSPRPLQERSKSLRSSVSTQWAPGHLPWRVLL